MEEARPPLVADLSSGTNGLGPLEPPTRLAPPPLSPSSSPTLLRAAGAAGLGAFQVSPPPRSREDELYLYGYGKQFGEKLTYSAGVAYATGMLGGGSYGLLSGIKRGGASSRLRLNAILNGCSTHAPALGSALGALSLFYCCFNNGLMLAGGDSEAHAPVAGALSGLLYKSRASWRVCYTYGVASAVAFTTIDQYLRRYC